MKTLQRSTLQILASDLLFRGYKVLCDRENKRNYFAYSDGINIAYVQKNSNPFLGIYMSKKYKGSKEYGTGKQVFGELFLEGEELLQKAKKTLIFDIIEAREYLYTNVQEYIDNERKRQKNYGEIKTKEEILEFIK